MMRLLVSLLAVAALCGAVQPPKVTFVETVVGSPVGAPMNGFEDGSGTNARFRQPMGTAVDPATGVLYLADNGNCAIRAIGTSSLFSVSTIAGSPPSLGRSCDFLDSSAAGINARFRGPKAMCIQEGALYISDADNNAIRSVALRSPGFPVTTTAGQTTAGHDDGIGTAAQFNSPIGIVYHGPSNSLLIADNGNSLLRRVSLTNRTVTTLAGQFGTCGAVDGPFTSASFCNPAGITVDPRTGLVYVAEDGNNRVRVVDIAAQVVRTLAGGTAAYRDGRGTEAGFNNPRGISYDVNTRGMVVADFENNALRWVSRTGVVWTIAGGLPPSPDPGHVDGDATTARFSGLFRVEVHPTRPRTYIVSDTYNGALRFAYYAPYSPSFSSTLTFAGSPSRSHSSSSLLELSSTVTVSTSHASSSSPSESVPAASHTGSQSLTLQRQSSSASVSPSRSVTLSASSTPSRSATSSYSSVSVSSSSTHATSHTATLASSCSQTIPLPPLAIDPVAAAAAAAKAQASSNVATVASMALGGDPATASQTAFLSIVACSSNRNSDRVTTPPPTSLTMVTISVFYAHGPLAMGLGNLALVAFTLLVHAGATMVVAWRTQTDFAAAAGHRFVRFPNFSLRIVAFLVPGTVYAAFLLLLDPASSGAALYVAGSLLLLPVFGLVAARHLLVTRVALRRAQYVLYPPGAALESLSFVEVPLFPNGRWTPQSQRFAFGVLLVPYSPRAVTIATVEMCAGLCLAAATAIATTRTVALCAAIMQAMCAVHFAVALWCGVMRPFRLKSDVVCATLTYALYGVVCLLLSLHTTSALAAAANVQVFCAVVSVLRLGAMFWVVWREGVVEQWRSELPPPSDETGEILPKNPTNTAPVWPTTAAALPLDVDADDRELLPVGFSAVGDTVPTATVAVNGEESCPSAALPETTAVDEHSALLEVGRHPAMTNRQLQLLAEVEGYFSLAQTGRQKSSEVNL